MDVCSQICILPAAQSVSSPTIPNLCSGLRTLFLIEVWVIGFFGVLDIVVIIVWIHISASGVDIVIAIPAFRLLILKAAFFHKSAVYIIIKAEEAGGQRLILRKRVAVRFAKDANRIDLRIGNIRLDVISAVDNLVGLIILVLFTVIAGTAVREEDDNRVAALSAILCLLGAVKQCIICHVEASLRLRAAVGRQVRNCRSERSIYITVIIGTRGDQRPLILLR